MEELDREAFPLAPLATRSINLVQLVQLFTLRGLHNFFFSCFLTPKTVNVPMVAKTHT